MLKADSAVRKETKYIICLTLIMSALMQAVFLVLGRWDYTVLLGNLLSSLLMIANFYFMGLSVQKALASGDEKDGRKIMKNSQSLRTLVIFIVVVIGVVSPVFSIIAVIIPLFFTRIAVALRPLWKDGQSAKEVSVENESE